ncbi:hypothetical protein FT993_10945 [Mesonia sp. HuA40]|nr:hypothetical protein FT993_10945 [Mesonia sp. HuA40]
MCFCSLLGFAQQTDSLTTSKTQDKFGIRVGLDLAKITRSFLDDDYEGVEITTDYRIGKKLFLAGEIGNEKKVYDEDYLYGNTQGQYIKLGVNYNAYENWGNMQNEIYAGFRYGYANFTQQLDAFEIYNTDLFFPRDLRTVNREFKNLSAHWVEIQGGAKAEILNNLFLGIHLQLKVLLNQKEPDGFGNLYIPGFHRVNANSSIGVGYGYSLSYLIPITKK